MRIFRKVDRAIETIQTVMCLLLFGSMVVFGFVQVFARYVLGGGPPWTEELIRFCAIWLAFVGSSLTIRDDAHVSVDILLGFLKNNNVRFGLYVVSRALAVVFLVWFFPASIDLIVATPYSRAAALPIGIAWVYLGVPVGIVSMLLSYCSALPQYAMKYKKGEL